MVLDGTSSGDWEAEAAELMGRLQARSLLTTPLLVVVNKIDVAGARSAKDVMPVITKVLKASNPLGIFYTLFQS